VEIFRDPEIARRTIREAKQSGRSIGLIPTMGALHEGHLSLVQAAQKQGDSTLVTLFVNPSQFGPNEDFSKYPRTEEADLERLRSIGADWVLIPTSQQVYPEGYSTWIEPPQVATRWEGEIRPGHFRGVATVVLKLFLMTPADRAYFGQKDYQQVRVIEQMVRDLSYPIDVRVCATIRELDGLAMSSRNRYLDPDQRRRALAIWRSILLVRSLASQGVFDTAAIQQQACAVLLENGLDSIDYAVLADAVTLEPLERIDRPAVYLVAGRLGKTRLIDNCLL
jgi:pantoate--beta-alanine ligase